MIRVVTQNLRKGERIDHHRRQLRSTGKPAKAHRGSEHPSVSAAMDSVGADRPRPNGFNSCPGHRESPGRLTHSCLGLRRPLAQLPVSGGCEAFVRAIVVAIDARRTVLLTPRRADFCRRSGADSRRPERLANIDGSTLEFRRDSVTGQPPEPSAGPGRRGGLVSFSPRGSGRTAT
jgi:hypothetical protein